MTIGKQVNLNELQNGLSDTVLRLRAALDSGHRIADWATRQTDADLEALGMTDPDDRYLFGVTVQDLEAFYQLWVGTATQAVAHDYRTYTDQVTGID